MYCFFIVQSSLSQNANLLAQFGGYVWVDYVLVLTTKKKKKKQHFLMISKHDTTGDLSEDFRG